MLVPPFTPLTRGLVSRKLTLETVYGEKLSQYKVPAGSAKIGIWVDDLAEPGTVHLQVIEHLDSPSTS